MINLAGILMNKAEPDDDDETPFNEFEKYMKVEQIDGQDAHYVDSSDVPKILFAIFVGQKDEKRVDAAELLQKYAGESNNK